MADEPGRLQILEIHTKALQDNNLLSDDVDLKELAVQTKNFSGAEIAGLVRAAQSNAMNGFLKVWQEACFKCKCFYKDKNGGRTKEGVCVGVYM